MLFTMLSWKQVNPPYKFKWTEKTVPVAEGSSETTTEGLKQGESINVQDLETNLYWEFGKFTSRDGESLESYYSRFYKMMNELVRNQCDVTNHQVNVQFLLQLQPEWQRSQPAATRNRGKAIVNSPPPTYDQEPATVADDDEMSKEKEIDKLMALISLSFKKIYKPTNNNLKTSSNTSRANQDNSLRINRGNRYYNQRVVNVAGSRENVETKRAKDAAYHKEKMLLNKQEEARVQLNAEQADWKDDTDDEPDDQELEAHYMYMAQIQEVTPDAADNSGPIFDAEPLQKVQNDDDNYNVFDNDQEHPEQPESVNEPYPVEQDEHNIIIDSLDMSYDREQDDQDDTDDLAKERDLLASLIEKLKCEIDDSKNRNKFLESSNKALVDKLKGEIEDFKTKNKSLESSNNHFKEANNELSKTNQLMFKDLKKFQAELDRYHDVNYASKVAIDCAKAKGDLMSYKIDFEKSSNAYTRKINDLNQTILDMKKELCAHQETISIMSQAKEAQIKLYKTREDKELDKVIALENKVKVLNDIVYKTGQSVQTMNMLNRNCKTSFAKPEFLKKAQRANPRLYDIGCYNDNLALMLAPESDETIRLEKERRSKLSDLIRPFDYDQLNNLYDLFVPQREKSAEQHYFPKTSKMSHTSANNEISKESFNKQKTLLEKRVDESIPWDQKCKISKELFKIKKSVDTIFYEVARCKQTIAKRTYFGNIDPFIQNTIEGNFCPQIRRINADLEKFHLFLNEEMVDDLRYFNSLEQEVDTLKSQLETQKTQFLNEIDRLSREYYYADHMNAILGVYTDIDEVSNLQCDYLETLEKCQHLEKELSKSRTMSKSFEALQKHAINLELDLQQCKEKIKNDKSFKENHSNVFLKEREQYFEIQDLKAQLQDKGIAISELKKLIEKMKGKAVETKFAKSSVIRQPNTFKSQTQSFLGKPTIFSDSLEEKDFSKSNVSRPQLKSNQLKDRVMSNNSQGKKQEVEDHRRNFKFSNNKMSVTACNASLNLRPRLTRQPIDVPISSRQPKHNVNQSAATSSKKTITTDSIVKKSRHTTRKLYVQLFGTLHFGSLHCYISDFLKGKRSSTGSSLAQILSKDETPAVLIDFLTLVQRGLHAQVTIVQTDKGTEFLNKTLHGYFAKEEIRHKTSTARTHKQNGIVERRNRTLIKVAQTMLSASAAKVPLFFWAEAIATTCFTQNHSHVIPRHQKTPYHIINARKPSVKFFHIVGSLCYIVRDGENLDKIKGKGDACIFVGYSTQSKAYRVFIKRTRIIVETIHVNFDELPQMASDHVSADPDPQCSTMSFAVHAADNPDKRQQHNTTHTSTTTDVADPPPLNI
ncbi:integrase, catalytic region, zinc finger, CCHC-type containing protein, partial [Tanacetum coccineum]